MMLDLQADDTFFFDADAADRPVRFIEKYLKHYVGRFAGRPFLLEPIQKKIIHDVYGWKSRATGFRRFTDVWLDGAVGCGKSPLLAAVALFGLIGDGEQGAQVYNFAATHPQARVVFDTAVKFIRASAQLESRLQVRHTEIRYPAKKAFWRILPGTGPGSGCNPSTIVGDESHEWVNGEAYNALRDRMGKRDQPLLWVATNAGVSHASVCWKLREKAVAALAGNGDPALYPVIWAAPDDAETDDPAAWRAANPLLGITMSEEKVRAKCVEALKDDEEEANFRRFYLGIWPKKKAKAWLDLELWDRAAAKPHEPTADAPVFAGLDLSQSDDLCAAVWVRVTHERMYVDSHFWMPKATAEMYVKRDGIPYLDWAEQGHVTLLDEPTVSDGAMHQIAAAVLARSGPKKPQAVCYDRFKADVCVKTLEAANVPCVPLAQGYSISPGCFELEKRLKAETIVITPNPVMRFCAENVTVKRDDRGNLWPVKPGAEDDREGLRSRKIDGIAALVTCLTQARKHAMPVKKVSAKAIVL